MTLRVPTMEDVQAGMGCRVSSVPEMVDALHKGHSEKAALVEAIKRALAFAEKVKAAQITFAERDAIDDHMADLWNATQECGL